MIRVQKKGDEIDDILQDNLSSESDEGESSENVSDSIDDFSTKVFKTLLSKQVAPLPLNYQTYFETLLNAEDIAFQKKIHELIESSNSSDDERNITFEKSIHSAFANTRDIMKSTSAIYKNLVIMNDIEKKWSLELKGESPNAKKYMQDTKAIQSQIDSQISQLKILYQKSCKILENINANTMYDSKFNTYNKRYYIYLVQNEQKMVEKFAHTSTIMMLSLPLAVTRYLQNDQTTALIVMKTVAKLLLKTSRRSDIIGYVGNGIFGMLLKHSDLFSTQKASERLIDLMNNTNVFLDKREIHLDLNIGISKLKQERSGEDSLNCAINALRSAQKSNVPYMIYKDDKE